MKNESNNMDLNARARAYSCEVVQENLETTFTGCDIFSSFTQDRGRVLPTVAELSAGDR